MDIYLISTITCPNCRHTVEEVMPTDACQHAYKCPECGTVLTPKPGDCCVFCSYGSVKCPSVQLAEIQKKAGTDSVAVAIHYPLEGMMCMACEATVKQIISDLPDVFNVEADWKKGEAVVYTNRIISAKDIDRAFEAKHLPYRVRKTSQNSDNNQMVNLIKF